jgi:ABC-type transport system involved in multi-copper enzyme maturation permease subunit
MILRQTFAIFHDAYRELNHKKLFWIVLAISGLVVAAFGVVGINDKGFSIMWWQIDSSIFNTSLMPRPVFYKTMFASLGVGVWLTWGAAILAIISVSSLIPDFVAGGSIDLVLSRPIGRMRLFLTKYAAGLLFVALQVGLFTTAAFLVIGLRGKAWEPGLFWCVPLVLLFFSYLWAVCALVGLVTRSTIASLLITMLVWLLIFGLHATEGLFQTLRIRDEMRLEVLDKDLTRATEHGNPTDRIERRIAEITKSSRWVRNTHRAVYGVKTLLPKTKETVALLERVLISQAEIDQLQKDDAQMPPMSFDPDDVRLNPRELQKRIVAEQRSRPLWWVLGTSVGFEAVVLGAACWIFARRDF